LNASTAPASDAPPPRRRASRRRRWAYRFIATILAFGLFVAWLLLTVSGRDTLLARVVGLLPPGSLSWERASGTVYGPLTLYGVHYRHDGVDFRARRVMLEASLMQLLGRRLHLVRLEADHAVLDLRPDDKPKPPPSWPGSLPKFAVPFVLDADIVQVRDLRIRRAGASVLVAQRVDGAAELGPGTLALHRLVVDSDRGHWRIDGEVHVARNYQLRIDADGKSAQSAELRLHAKGDLDHFTLAADGRAPEPFALRLTLDDGRVTPKWTLSMQAPRFDPALFAPLPSAGSPVREPVPYAIALQARGIGGAADVQGDIARGNRKLVVAPSKLAYDNGVLDAHPLVLKLLDGDVLLNGHADLKPASPVVDAIAQLDRLRWSAAERATPVEASGKLALSGTVDAWHVQGALDLLRDRQHAQVALAGSGNRRGMTFDHLDAHTPLGGMKAHASLQWTPLASWNIDAALQGFDPGYFAPGFEGAVSGRAVAHGGIDAGGVASWQAAVDDLSGQLRGRRLGGHGVVAWRAGVGKTDVDLRIGASHVQLEGAFGNTLDLLAHFDPLHLDDLLPDAQGSLNGQVTVRGETTAPSVEGHLQGGGLKWRRWGAARIALDGNLPSKGGEGALHATAEGVTGIPQLNGFDLHVAGSEQSPRVTGDLRGANGTLALSGNATHQGAAWNGHVASLRYAPPHGDAWNLVSPTDFQFTSVDAFRLQHTCLRSPAATVCADADWPHRANLQAHGVPLALLDPWLVRPDIDARAYGTADIDAHVAPGPHGGWTGAAQLHSATGGVHLQSDIAHPLLGYTGLTAHAELEGTRVQLRLDSVLTAGGTLHAQATTGVDSDAALAGNVALDLRDITWVELFSTDLAAPSGRFSGQLALSGTRAHPALSGRAVLDGFTAELPALGIALKDGRIQLDADPGGAARVSGSLRSGDGILTLGGALRWNDPNAPLSVTVTGQNVRIADTPELDAIASPDLQIGFAAGVLSVRGKVVVPKAQMNLERLDNTVAPSPDVVVLDPAETAHRSALATDIDLNLALGDDVKLKGYGLDGKLGGQLRVRREPGHAMTGSGALDVSGRYAAYGQQLEIVRGRLGYNGGGFDNPTLDILAQREFDQATVGVQVRGTALRPVTTIVSSPAMSPNDALAYLVLGRPLQTASSAEGRQISAASAALSVGGNLISQKVGARLGLDQAGISESRALGDAAFTVGKYVTPRLFVSYGVSVVGTGEVLTLKYLLRKGFDIQVESSRENRASINWRIEK